MDHECVDLTCALMWASHTGHTRTIAIFLNDERVDMNARDFHGTSALVRSLRGWNDKHTNVYRKCNDAFFMLWNDERVQKGLTNDDKQHALHVAAVTGNNEVVQFLLQCAFMDPNGRYIGISHLSAAVKAGSRTISIMLEDKRLESGEDYQLAFQQACLSGRVDVVMLFLADSRMTRRCVEMCLTRSQTAAWLSLPRIVHENLMMFMSSS